MARVSRKKAVKRPANKRSELTRDLIAIAMVAVGVFVALCLWQSPSPADKDLLGIVGGAVCRLSLFLFGQAKWLPVIAMILLGASQWLKAARPAPGLYAAYGVAIMAGCAICHLRLPAAEQLFSAGLEGLGGGVIGGGFVQLGNRLIGVSGSWIFSVALAAGALLVITGKTVKELASDAGRQAKSVAHTAQSVAHTAQSGLTLLAGKREPKVIGSLNVPIDTGLAQDKRDQRDAGLRERGVRFHDYDDTAAGQTAGGEGESDARGQGEVRRQGGGAASKEASGEGRGPERAAANQAPTQSATPTPGAASAASRGKPSPTAGAPAGAVFAAPAAVTPAVTQTRPASAGGGGAGGAAAADRVSGAAGAGAQVGAYRLPDINLLQSVPKVKSQRLNRDITENVRILEDTLASFGVKAVVTQVNRGPSITRFELQPEAGVKVSKIVNLSDDLALALAAAHIRIEAPIPGKAAIGIEVPNTERALVSLREILEDQSFQQAKSKLSFALGRDIAGAPIVVDLARTPHLLIAGTTGSGKSVCMNALIASILISTTPDEVKMMMIDPKMVELSNYNGIPHLIHPVVTDPKKAAKALRWAVHEMEKRYDAFAKAGVKDLPRYNAWLAGQPGEDKPLPLPQFVVLIDELADLMMVAPADVEDAIMRLAQMARAAGMHLVVATQRPSADVITGPIKANIPSRIAFAVSSQVDSRVILDMGGAEKLLGQGDMLFKSLEKPKPVRVQGVYVSDSEIEKLTAYLQTMNTQPDYVEDVTHVEEESREEEDEELDSLLGDAARIFIESGQASISLLQRRLRIGYTRAARIIDQMEGEGIVGGFEGSKARLIRMTMAQYEERFGKGPLKKE